MAREERKKEDLYIKEVRKSKNFFVTSSVKMDGDKERTSTTISSSVFTKMKNDFDAGDFLLDEHLIGQNGSIIYMMQQMQEDLQDVYNEVSASSFQASFFPFARIDSGSFGVVSSSLVPDRDSKYDLGSSGKEWNDLYVDGTAYIDSLDLNGTNINTTLNTKALKTHISGAFTSLSASIATDINNAGGGNADFSSVGESIIPTIDDKMDLGASNKQFKNLYLDGTAHIDVLSADTLAKPVAPAILTAQSFKSTLVDVSLINVLQVNISKSVKVEGFASEIPGHEITIINLGSGAVQLVRSTKGAQRTIYGSSNITISQNEVYKLVMSSNKIWYVL